MKPFVVGAFAGLVFCELATAVAGAAGPYAHISAALPGWESAIALNEQHLSQNIFRTKVADPDHDWLSVSNGGYQAQFYSRDTFVTAREAMPAGAPFRDVFKNAVEWFSSKMEPDGYVPLWFREGAAGQLEEHLLCPYNRAERDGGVKQYDNVAEYVDAVNAVYQWGGDRSWIARYSKSATKAWKWLNAQTDDTSLVRLKVSAYCGSDWADRVQRGGYATFSEVSYLRATESMAEIARAVGDAGHARFYSKVANRIRAAINRLLWRYSAPLQYSGPPFGHYAAWIAGGKTYDYFETDSNAYAIADGVASRGQAAAILDFIDRYRSYFVDRYGATRVLWGDYSGDVTDIRPHWYHNGGYWYITSAYLADAYRRMGMADELALLLSAVVEATQETRDVGLGEFYDDSLHLGGAPNYSWSLALPLSLSFRDIAGATARDGRITFHPCVAPQLGTIHVAMTVSGQAIAADLAPGCDFISRVSN